MFIVEHFDNVGIGAGDELHTVPGETVPMGYLVAYFRKVEQSDTNVDFDRDEASTVLSWASHSFSVTQQQMHPMDVLCLVSGTVYRSIAQKKQKKLRERAEAR